MTHFLQQGLHLRAQHWQSDCAVAEQAKHLFVAHAQITCLELN
jgi:hypothetical protein